MLTTIEWTNLRHFQQWASVVEASKINASNSWPVQKYISSQMAQTETIQTKVLKLPVSECYTFQLPIYIFISS